VLPEGHDPDSLLRADGAGALDARLEAARPLLSFVLEAALREEDLSTARGRATAHARVALLLSKVANAEEATPLSREAAGQLGGAATHPGIGPHQLRGARARTPRVPRPAAAPATSSHAPPILAERDLLALLLHVEEARIELLPLIEDRDVMHPG